MSFPRYPAYKPSGVAWLGEVPEHWDTKPLWSLFRRTKRQGYEEEELLSVYRDHGVIPKSSRDDNFNKPSDDLSAYQLVEPGDLTVNKMKAWQGSVAISNYRGIVSPAYHVYSPLHSENSRFLHYLMRCDRYTAAHLSLSKGIRVNQWDLQPEYHSRMAILLPPMEEQATIATFLDHETTKIDALIAEQQRLIELLQEKRQAVISHAVTKGLNPDAPMKDSGVEWLGEVPAHWDVRKISQLFVGIGSGTTPRSDEIEYYEDGDIPWVVTGDLNDELLESCSNFITRKAMQAHTTLRLYPKGSVAVAMYGATIGKAALFGLEATVNQACCVLPPSVKVNENLLLHFIISARNHLISLATGGGQPNINQDIVRSLRIPIPEVDEQIEIVEHLSKILVELEGLLRLSDRQVRLLQERRSALISAAVTGQIDVRGLVPEARTT
jgi:type I restriction enzyme S subunit